MGNNKDICLPAHPLPGRQPHAFKDRQIPGIHRCCNAILNALVKLAWFITYRLARTPSKAFSRLIIRIATVAIALSMAVMIITSALVKGFQQTISDKVYGFMGHVLITQLDVRKERRSMDELPLLINQPFYPGLTELEGIRHIQVFGRKAGIIKNGQDIEGIIVRGIGPDFDWNSFGNFIAEGERIDASLPDADQRIMISRSTQRRMGFDVGDELAIFFIDQSEEGKFRQRARLFVVGGIYHTGLEEYDKLFALADIRQIRRINGWSEEQAGGFEVYLDDARDPDVLQAYTELIDVEAGPFLRVNSIRQLEPNIFDWLNLQGQNERIIMSLMMIVALINMITSLLILILERTHMIGVLKALGAGDWAVRRIFLGHAAWIIGIGLAWGNLLGLGVCLAQQEFGFLQLPEESYYVTQAPVVLEPLRLLMLNVGTLLICTVFLIVPSWLATRVNPITALRFD